MTQNLQNLKEEDVVNFVTKILGKEMNDNLEISFLDWKMNVHAIYIDEPQKTQNILIKQFSTLSEKDYKNFNEMNHRMLEIFEHASKIQAKINYFL